MSTALLTEELRPFAQIAKSHPALTRVSPRSLSRWWRVGTVAPDGTTVRLEGLRVGGRMMTSLVAVDRYLSRTNAEPTAEESTPTRSPAERQKASEAAERQLQDAGV